MSDVLAPPSRSALPMQFSPTRIDYDWSASRAHINTTQKMLMGRYFAIKDFLVPFGKTSAQERDTVASIIVGLGTTPNTVVEECIKMLREYKSSTPIFLTWYTPGHLIPATLKSYRDKGLCLCVR
jgi:hypothetical protein